MSVANMVHGTDQSIGVHKWEKLFGFVRTHQIALQTQGMVLGQNMTVFIETILGGSQAQAPCGMPARTLPCFSFQLLIKTNAVVMQTGICSCRGPLDNIAGSYPGRT